MNPVAIEVRDLDKSFPIPLERHSTLKERALRPRTWLHRESRRLEALRGISFDIHQGEFFGIIGRNGCGKSTLLKLMASIYRADAGSIRVAGRLAPFIELGVGFNPELSARDNVVLNGVMMGLTPTEAHDRFDAVLDYAELWDYTELKLKNYSSGMRVRLAFALMIQVEADILLVDEVLAVGDAAFKRKCTATLEEMQAEGRTVVMVTHDMSTIRSRCDRAMLIEDGGIELIGDPLDVAERYMELLFDPAAEEEGERKWDGHGAKVTAAWISGPDGRTTEGVPQGEPFTANVTIRAEEELRDPTLAVELVNNPDGIRVAAFVIGPEGEIPRLAPGEEVTVRLHLADSHLGAGNYRFSYALFAPDPTARDSELRVLDRSAEPLRLSVQGPNREAGIVSMGHEVTVDRGVAEARK